MKDLLLEMLRYNSWANGRLAETIADLNQQTPERTRNLFSHIINAQSIWYSRLSHQQAPFKVFQLHEVPTLISLAGSTSASLYNWLDKLPESKLSDKYTYANTQGKTYTNTVQQILSHLINHSTYHRAQIATDMRQNGLEPLNTDYIAYAREVNGEL